MNSSAQKQICVGDGGGIGDGGFSCSQSQPNCVEAVVPAIHFIII